MSGGHLSPPSGGHLSPPKWGVQIVPRGGQSGPPLGVLRRRGGLTKGHKTDRGDQPQVPVTWPVDNSKNQKSAIDPRRPEIGGLLLCADCLTRARDLAAWLDQHPPK